MFVILFIIGAIFSIFRFVVWADTDFQNTECLISFLSMVIATLLCYRLLKMEEKVNKNEDDIKKLKAHLGIIELDPPNSTSDDIEK